MSAIPRLRSGRALLAYLALTVFFAALLLIFLVFVRQAFSSYDQQEQECRDSILAHSLLAMRTNSAPTSWLTRQLGVDPREDYAPKTLPLIACEARERFIDNERSDAGSRVAKEMEFCWERWQEGDIALSTGKPNTVVCNPCSTLYFDEPQQPLTGLKEALAARGGARGEALSGTLPEQCGGTLTPSYPASLPDNSVVLFVYARGTDAPELLASDAVASYTCNLPTEQIDWASMVVVGPNTPDFLVGLGCDEVYQGARSTGVEVLD